MDAKENREEGSSQLKKMTEAEAPTLRQRMDRLLQLRSAWDSEEPVSPLPAPHHRASIAPDSGQVTHMKARFAALAQEYRDRHDDYPHPPAPARRPTEPQKRRWTPPRPAEPAPPRPGSPLPRSPSPCRAEMPASPRGGGHGCVESPRHTPVSVRAASWERHIASNTSQAAAEKSPPVPLQTTPVSLKRKPPIPPRTTPSLKGKAAVGRGSVRRQRCRQQDMKYTAGLAAVGFEVEAQPSPDRKRKSEERPTTSSGLLHIISQADDAVQGKRARLLNLMTPTSFANPHVTDGQETLTPVSPDSDEETEVSTPDASQPADPRQADALHSYMEEMWRAERRASLAEESLTEVTTEANTESDLDDDMEEQRQTEIEDASCPCTEEEDTSSMQTEVEEAPSMQAEVDDAPSMQAKVEEAPSMQAEVEEAPSMREEVDDAPSMQAEVKTASSMQAEVDDAPSMQAEVEEASVLETEITSAPDVDQSPVEHDECTRRKFLQFMQHRETRPPASPRRRPRRSSSMSDLSSPLLLRPSTLERSRRPSRLGLAYTVEGYRSTVLEGRVSPAAPRVYSMEFAEVAGEAVEGRERVVMGVASRIDANRVAGYEQQAAQQEEVIYQASKALHQVVAAGRAGSAQHIECSRVLAVACQRRQALLEEASRLRQGPASLPADCSACCVLTLSGLRLVLKADYRQRIQAQQARLQTGQETALEQHHFLCLLKLPGGRVHATEVAATGTDTGPSARDFIEIPSCLTVKDLPQDFTARLEVYGLSLSRVEKRMGTPGKERTPRKLLRRLRTGRAAHGRSEAAPGGSPGAWTAHTGFSLLSSIRLSPESVGQSVFPLLRLPSLSPLEGIVQLRLRVTSEPRIERRGFVSVFAEVGGFGSWLRRWCSLRRDSLLMWLYPDEEVAGAPPHLSFDLRQCVTRRVELLSKEECARPFTLRLHLLRPAREGEADNLVLTRRGDLVLEKFLLSAESRAEQVEWADSLNDCLFMMRQVHAEQFRALEAKAQSLSV